MKRMLPPENPTRFKGTVRHYHRSASKSQSSWEQWISGEANSGRPRKSWLKILGILVALLVLGGVIAGLVIKMS